MGTVGGLQSMAGLTIIQQPGSGLVDQDWFRWTAAASEAFHVVVNNIQAGGGDLHVRVFGQSSNGSLSLLGGSSLTGGVSSQNVSVAATAGQVLYVWVFGFNFAQGSCDLAVNLT